MSWKQHRPFYLSRGIEQIKSETGYVLELAARIPRYSKSRGHEVRIEFPDGSTSWAYPSRTTRDAWVIDGQEPPAYVMKRMARLWRDMEAVMN